MPELTRRYVVMTMATESPFDMEDPEGAFVLKPWKDPAALRALRAYRENCYAELAQDLDDWIRRIEAGPVIRGDVGRRNEPHVKAGPAKAGPRRPARAKRRPAAKARRAAPPRHPRASSGRAPGKKKRRR